MTTWMNDPLTITICLGLAVLRIYLEVINFDFARLPVTSKMMPKEQAQRFHKMGFYFSLGYFITFAPGMLLS
ncbi:MAG: hypothetical protein K2P81_01145 [Bacteriovoracaceae bacterium]|nr:hypothetical protein [Bacteriovoracaceae bacterium]